MYRTLLLILLFGHMVADFYLQPAVLAIKKKTSYRFVLLHCAIYTFVLFIGMTAMWSPILFFVAGILSALHLIIDSLKFFLIKPRENRDDVVVYFVDQSLHIAPIVITVILLKSASIQPSTVPVLINILSYLRAEPLTLLRWLCLLAFICKPANITIQLLTLRYRPEETQNDSSKKNTSAIIGIIERMIIVLLLSVNQYASIGLVLAAKSVTRYRTLNKPELAEYYLIGTLLSTLLVVAAYLMLFVLI